MTLHRYHSALYAHRSFLEGAIIFISLLAVGFNVDSTGIGWFWIEYPLIGVVLVSLSLTLGLLRLKI